MDKTCTLPPDVAAIVIDKATEYPNTGCYNKQTNPGTYLCRRCGLALFRGEDKFNSGCGWPSFDATVADHIHRAPDADGRRTEILCQRCQAHLGHVFFGEQFTANNIRHCVNSLALDFVPDTEVLDTEEAILAAGCFWGVEYYLKRLPGVLKTEVGYSGGQTPYPTYEAVCTGTSGHVEAIRVLFDSKVLSYESLIQYFFEIHDPTQENGQGPDLGSQYLSRIFFLTGLQQKTAMAVKAHLQAQGLKVATHILPATIFWPAEPYHQDYYAKTAKMPYCHQYTKRF